MKDVNSSWDNEYTQNEISPIYEPLWESLKEFYSKKNIKTVLDFGCGDGNYSFLMQQDDLNVLGVDISNTAIEKALVYKELHKINNIDFKVSNTTLKDIDRDSFDMVVLLNSFHCLKKTERVELLSQIKKLLKKGQYLFMSVLSLDDESFPRDKFIEIEKNTFDDTTGKLFHFFSDKEIKEELQEFQILNIEKLENIHPDIGKKSSLYIVSAVL